MYPPRAYGGHTWQGHERKANLARISSSPSSIYEPTTTPTWPSYAGTRPTPENGRSRVVALLPTFCSSLNKRAIELLIEVGHLLSYFLIPPFSFDGVKRFCGLFLFLELGYNFWIRLDCCIYKVSIDLFVRLCFQLGGNIV